MPEAYFYNALAISTKNAYPTLSKARARWGSWQKSWEEYHGSRTHPEKSWQDLHSFGIKLILFEDEDFPPLLREIPHPPFGIYVLGSLPAIQQDGTIAIVGTRKATPSGKMLAKEFALTLAQTGTTIVSGLAFGIDAAAHEGALAINGTTVAVLGCGLDRIYPASNERLARYIIEKGGAIISEYPPHSPPLGYRFLERNRIISGLSRAVLIIEAPERSGVIATARYALEQNRDLYVVPGSVNHANYKGSHKLIRAGASLVTTPMELMEDMGFAVVAGTIDNKVENLEEQRVIDAIRGTGTALTIDEIIEAAKLTSSIVNGTLTMLILRGIIKEENDRYALR